MDHFQPGGSVSQLLPGFEYRTAQNQMALAIARVLRRGDAGLFEAGTGTGKSLAYLIPAVEHAINSGEPIVIATHTISLQQQLLDKDIPVVQHIFPELKAVLVKGWRNYICHLRLHAAMSSPGQLFASDVDDELHKIDAWAANGEENGGTLADLPFEPRPAVWGEVCAESESCLRAQCPFYDRCPLFRDRRRMDQAHLLIVNHHLLFSDVSIRRQTGWDSEFGVLPRYNAAIIDESHHIEETATHYFGATLSSAAVGRLMRRVRGRGRRDGLIAQLKAGMDRPDEGAADGSILERDALLACGEAEQAFNDVFSAAMQWTGNQADRNGEKHRIDAANAVQWEAAVGPKLEAAEERLSALIGALAAMYRRLPGTDSPTWDKGADEDQRAAVLGAALKAQFEGTRRRLDHVRLSLRAFGVLRTEAHVYWLQREEKDIQLVTVPIDVGDHIEEWVAATCDALVLVSATMAVSGSFSYFKERLGLSGSLEIADRMDIVEESFPSPFDYREQSLLAIVRDLPPPTHAAYETALPSVVQTLVETTRGRALVLFTSTRLLRQTAEALRVPLADAGLPLLAQGDAPRYQLLESFRQLEASVLFGTDSFWEGVDVPGDALSSVLLTRLPFDVPTDPVAQARCEQLDIRGRSPFYDYSVPRAALKLKQGFGRLIRSSRERGVVIICDGRIDERAYGSIFLDTLPPAPVVRGSVAHIAQTIADFLSVS